MQEQGLTKIMAAKKRLQEAVDILDKTDGETICYADKLECLSNLIRATDSLRRITSGDEDYSRKPESQVTTIWKELGYGIEKKDYGLKIILPAVLPKKASGRNEKIRIGQAEKEFARKDLTVFLKEEKEQAGITDSFMTDIVVIFTHERPGKGLFDYDNLSTSPYLNAVSDCFLAADTARNIDFLQRFEQAPEERTIVYLVKKDQFAEWSKRHY